MSEDGRAVWVEQAWDEQREPVVLLNAWHLDDATKQRMTLCGLRYLRNSNKNLPMHRVPTGEPICVECWQLPPAGHHVDRELQQATEQAVGKLPG